MESRLRHEPEYGPFLEFFFSFLKPWDVEFLSNCTLVSNIEDDHTMMANVLFLFFFFFFFVRLGFQFQVRLLLNTYCYPFVLCFVPAVYVHRNDE